MNKHLRTILLLFLVSANAFAQKPIKSISPKAQIGDLKILNAQIPYNTTYSKVEHFTFSAIDGNKLKNISKPTIAISGFVNPEVGKNYEIFTKQNAFNSALDVIANTALKNIELRFKDYWVDDMGYKHVKLAQQIQNIDVYSSEAIVHFKNNQAYLVNYNLIDPSNINVLRAKITNEKAIEIVEAKVKEVAPWKSTAYSEMDKAIAGQRFENEQVIYYYNNEVYNAFHITVRPNLLDRYEYFIDANNGNVIHFYNHICSINGPATAQAVDLNGITRSINTYDVSSTFYLIDGSRSMFNLSSSNLPNSPVGALWTIDARNTYGSNLSVSQVQSNNNSWSSATSVSAHYNVMQAYDYFQTTFTRNSIDGKGGNVVSIINVNDPSNGQAMDNAYWNGQAMYYGNGKTAFFPLAKGLDVAGHEMTHGVVQNTANLDYNGESGAINESFADVFGSLIDRNDWLIGEDVVKTSAFPSGALRSMSDPHNGGTSLSSPGYQPRHMSEKYTGTQDNGGVHINSGIPNWAYYKIATVIGKNKAEAIYYRALTNYLTRSSQFKDLRLAIVQSAKDLYGASSAEVTACENGFTDVGIGQSSGGNYQQNLPVNPGADYLLTYDTDNSSALTLTHSTVSGTNFTALSTTSFNSKPSVTDNGTIAVFISSDDKMRMIDLNLTTPNERIIQSNPTWGNVAISKDGTRIAAVTKYQDTAIFVFDLVSGNAVKYTLYNPTFSQGVSSDGPLYADALEWDYSGEYLVYDCYNSIKSQSGTNIEYWDLNFIKVWDNATNNFAQGQISQLFTSLPADVSIGNPTFSKNSPHILAFDYIDSRSIFTSYSVLGVNIESGEVDQITTSSTIGYPNYSKFDDKIAYDSKSLTGVYTVREIALDANKIKGIGSSSALINDAIWPVYYTIGYRNTQLAIDKASTMQGIDIFPNPANTFMNVAVKDQSIKHIDITINDIAGKQVKRLQLNTLDQSVSRIDVDDLSNGFYLVKIKTNKEEYKHKLLITR